MFLFESLPQLLLRKLDIRVHVQIFHVSDLFLLEFLLDVLEYPVVCPVTELPFLRSAARSVPLILCQRHHLRCSTLLLLLPLLNTLVLFGYPHQSVLAQLEHFVLLQVSGAV